MLVRSANKLSIRESTSGQKPTVTFLDGRAGERFCKAEILASDIVIGIKCKCSRPCRTGLRLVTELKRRVGKPEPGMQVVWRSSQPSAIDFRRLTPLA